MKKELDEKLQTAFPWLKQPELHKEKPYDFVEGYNHYENYGFDEVGDGWYQLIYDLCTEIEKIYKEAGQPVTMIAYNILRMLGQETVHQGKAPAKRIVSRKRIRTVIQNIIHFAGQLSRHARQLFLSISRSNAWANTFLGLVQRFVAC